MEVLVRIHALLRRLAIAQEESSTKRRPVAINGFDHKVVATSINGSQSLVILTGGKWEDTKAVGK